MEYVYIYWIDDVPFYVGKGRNRRYREHLQPCEYGNGSTLMQRKIAKLIRQGRRDDIKITFFIKDVDEATAFFWEKFLIASLGRRCDRDGPLCNLSWGGDRTNTGYRHGSKARKKITKAVKERWRNTKQRSRIIKGMRGVQRHRKRSPEISARLAEVGRQRQDELIRRLQAGGIHWDAERKTYTIFLSQQYIAMASTYVEAEWLRVEACKAARDGHLDAFIAEQREAGQEKIRARSEQCRKVREQKRYTRQVERHAEQFVRNLMNGLKENEKRASRAEELDEKPWLVPHPYFVYALLVDGVVKFVGFGKQARVQKTVTGASDVRPHIQKFVRENEVECRVIGVETREMAIAWRTAWLKQYQPEVNVEARQRNVAATSETWKTRVVKVTPEMRAAIEKDDRPARVIAAEHGISPSTVTGIRGPEPKRRVLRSDGQIFPSVADAAKAAKLAGPSSLRQHLAGHTQTCGGFTWGWADEVDVATLRARIPKRKGRRGRLPLSARIAGYTDHQRRSISKKHLRRAHRV